MWVTYKFYDEKGRRLTIIGRVVADSAEEQKDGSVKFENEQLEIHVVTCSKHDEFSRKAVRTLIDTLREGLSIGNLDFHPQIFHIPIKDKRPKGTLITWCYENYFKREKATFMFDAYVLAKGDDILPGIVPCGPLEFADLAEGRVPKTKKDGV